MQNSSDEEEFYDAVGDVAQIEEMKARLSQTRDNYNEKNNQGWNPSKSNEGSYISPSLKSSGTKKQNLEENENSLVISEKEAKEPKDGIHDSSSRNLQQILDKLDENSEFISVDQGNTTGIKAKDASCEKEHEFDSPFGPSKTNQTKVKAPISPFKKAGKSDETHEDSKSQSPKSSRSNKSNGSPTKSKSGSGKKSFNSFIAKKRSGGSEFSRESVKQHNKTTSNFDKLLCLQAIEDEKKIQQQELAQNSKKTKNVSPIWIAKFSPNNRYLATGGSDGVLKIYPVRIMQDPNDDDLAETNLQILDPNCINLVGHKCDIIDISWYKDSNLVLTSAIEQTVILWSVEKQMQVKIFEHSDIVPCLSFHPLVNEFFTTGCFDKMIRIWDINESKVVDWVQTNDLITALTFSPDKSHLLVGFYKGTVKIYRTDQGKLKFIMEITCKNTFSWGKLNKVGKKVTAIVFTEDYEFLVMTNDSRMRLIDMKTYETKMKYKGHASGKHHIQPSYNYEKELIISGSEDEKTYVWDKYSTYVPQINPIYSLQKAHRNTSYEFFKPFPKYNTTCAIWVPFPALQKYKEKVLNAWKDIYVDNLMILFSSDGRIKVLGNLIELEHEIEKKK